MEDSCFQNNFGFKAPVQSDAQMEKSRVCRLNCPESQKKFQNNKISTTKYTPFTFVPLLLFDQFSKPANFYFLIISSLQQIPGLSPTGRWGTLLPLLLSLIVSAGKEIFEDLFRANEDESINKRKVLIVGTEDLEEQLDSINLESLQVGQIVRILRDELIPADLVLLKSSESDGLCYLETAAIDGENNLKLRQARSEICKMNQWTDATITCDTPNNEIYNFQGSFKIPDCQIQLPLGTIQFLPRGTHLVNTEWILGVIVYTGTDTKIMQNIKDSSRRKVTKMDKLNDLQNAQIVAILFFLVAILFSGHVYYNRNVLPAHWYLHFQDPPFGSFQFLWSYFANLVTFILLLNNLVPISLSVTLEVVRTFLAKLINNDLDMYDEELQIPSKAQSSNVLDELGRIEYIMTDKTGTLTCNQMNLKALMINGQIYKNCLSPNSSLLCKISANSESVQQFLELISLCHTVMIDKRDGSLQASSPDELALLKGTKELGVAFVYRTSESVELEIFNGTKKSFEIKATIEFTSDRKRMSVVIFDPQSGKHFIVTKGADSVVLPLCFTEIEAAVQCVKDFSFDGLRTLCFAYKELENEEFEAWYEQWNEAVNTIGSQRQERLDSCIKAVESDLNFLGVSGIEDLLQAGVSEAITTLQAANIKIWILTGDRGETAVNTACLSGILKSHHKLIKLVDASSVNEYLSRPRTNEAVVLLVSGEAFAFILADPVIRKSFIPVSERARALIACRLSPLQKTEITHFVQNDLGKTTLAVGDGGNDVGMIQAADVGVGMNGLEGTQAARSSDFSIAKFRFLVKLLLVHGAWSFHRISRVILYMMYKNFVLVLCQFWFAFFNSFSSQSAFNPYLLVLFNSLFSVAPPALIGISDQYVTAPELIKHPQLYQFGQKGKFYDQKAFWECIANATVQSFTASACFYLLIQVDPIFHSGNSLSLNLASDIFYLIILAIVSFKVALFTNFFTRLMGIALISALILCVFIISLKTSVSIIFTSIFIPSATILVTIATLLRDFVWKFYKRQFKPRAYHIVQEMRAVQNRREKRKNKNRTANSTSDLLSKSSSIESETTPLSKMFNKV